MPLKRAVLPLLDRADPLVRAVGGANTVLLAAEQRLGYNTDVPGMVRALCGPWGGDREAVAAVAADPPALILGGGATGCAALGALRDLDQRRATVAVRDLARTGELRAAADRLGMSITVRTLDEVALGTRLVISTLPVGAADVFATGLSGLAPAPEVVFDVVYHPWPTPLAAAAAAIGAAVVGGLDLLVHQAARQVELMTGRPAPLEEMRRAGIAELARRSAAA
jgi:shikimate dehydrogenase